MRAWGWRELLALIGCDCEHTTAFRAWALSHTAVVSGIVQLVGILTQQQFVFVQLEQPALAFTTVVFITNQHTMIASS